MSDSPISVPKPFAGTLCLYCYSPILYVCVYLHVHFPFLLFSIALMKGRTVQEAEYGNKTTTSLTRRSHFIHYIHSLL